MRTRFAPSPTGLLHVGHARAAREAFDFAKLYKGQCLLRIEDTDHTRCKDENTHAIYSDLDWLGFDWPLPVRLQSQHYPDYAKVIVNLIRSGLAYPCILTRSEIKAGQTPSPLNPTEFGEDTIIQTLTHSSKTETPNLPFAIRLDLSTAMARVQTDRLIFQDIGPVHNGHHNAYDVLRDSEDPIIARKDIGCSYMIAGPHDDALQGMTHVVRGADLFAETPLQVLIQTLMDWPRPLYYHHELVRNDTGEKLSKRNLDTTLQSLREAGQTPQNILEMIK